MSMAEQMTVSEGLPDAPVSILIAALGGEGGGLLTDWVVSAAEREGFIFKALLFLASPSARVRRPTLLKFSP